jgi:hypothetical protein
MLCTWQQRCQPWVSRSPARATRRAVNTVGVERTGPPCFIATTAQTSTASMRTTCRAAERCAERQSGVEGKWRLFGLHDYLVPCSRFLEFAFWRVAVWACDRREASSRVPAPRAGSQTESKSTFVTLQRIPSLVEQPALVIRLFASMRINVTNHHHAARLLQGAGCKSGGVAARADAARVMMMRTQASSRRCCRVSMDCGHHAD